MFEPFQKAGEQFQRIGKDNFDAAVRSYGELNKGLQAISAKLVDYSKEWFEQTTKALEQLVGAKSLEQAFRDPISVCQESLRPACGRDLEAERDVHHSRTQRLQARRAGCVEEGCLISLSMLKRPVAAASGLLAASSRREKSHRNERMLQAWMRLTSSVMLLGFEAQRVDCLG